MQHKLKQMKRMRRSGAVVKARVLSQLIPHIRSPQAASITVPVTDSRAQSDRAAVVFIMSERVRVN